MTLAQEIEQKQDELNSACEAEGFEYDDPGLWMADDRGFVMLTIHILRPTVVVEHGMRKDTKREFEAVTEAVAYAKGLVA